MARILVGTVVSDKADKTIIVRVQTRKTHPLYRKQFTVSKKIAAHDDKNEAAVGDKVAIVETRPVSVTKHFRLDKIVERPALRSEDLEVASSEDTGKKPTKLKTSEEVEEKPVVETKPKVGKKVKKS